MSIAPGCADYLLEGAHDLHGIGIAAGKDEDSRSPNDLTELLCHREASSRAIVSRISGGDRVSADGFVRGLGLAAVM
jgi:hypothetical protein